jgi:hypothetical protein
VEVVADIINTHIRLDIIPNRVSRLSRLSRTRLRRLSSVSRVSRLNKISIGSRFSEFSRVSRISSLRRFSRFSRFISVSRVTSGVRSPLSTSLSLLRGITPGGCYVMLSLCCVILCDTV